MKIEDCHNKFKENESMDEVEGAEAMVFMRLFAKEYEDCISGYPVGDRNIARGFTFACTGAVKRERTLIGAVGSAFLNCSRCIYYLN